MAFTLEGLRAEYQTLFSSIVISPGKLPEVDRHIDKIIANKGAYTSVSQRTGVPWHVIACIHLLEASLRFDRHLHNGDPLTAKTVHVPSGRPAGNPPFTWESSAIDALQFDGLSGLTEWSIEATLFVFEKFNGFGYRRVAEPIHSPYLWSGSNHYTRGKFIGDGVYSVNTVSQQIGAAVILKRLAERGAVELSAPTLEQLSVLIDGDQSDVPAFLEKGNSWIGVRNLIPHLSGAELVGVKNVPKFEITIARRTPGSLDPASNDLRDFDARNIGGVGFVDASDLIRGFLKLGLDFDGTSEPGRLMITSPTGNSDDIFDDRLAGGERVGELRNASVRAPKALEPADGQAVLTREDVDEVADPVADVVLPPAIVAAAVAPDFPRRLIAIAVRERKEWQENALHECSSDRRGSKAVAEYWATGLRRTDTDGCDRDVFWSAAFICYCMREAGMPDTEFPYSEAHHRYIRWAIQNTLHNKPNKTYYGRKVDSHRPKPGDLIAAWRSDHPVQFDSVPDGFFPSHTDIVVAVSDNAITTIGGNVDQRVMTKSWPANDGLLLPNRTLICVMECRKV